VKRAKLWQRSRRKAEKKQKQREKQEIQAEINICRENQRSLETWIKTAGEAGNNRVVKSFRRLLQNEIEREAKLREQASH